MPKVPVSAETLNNLGDGYAGKAIDAALEVINRDLIDRGHDLKPRKLVVTYTFTPAASGNIKINVQTKTTTPAYQPPDTMARYDQHAGGFVFSPDAAGNPDQTTLADLDTDGE